MIGYSQLQRQVVFGQLSVNDGLSQNSVVSIAQDSTGYLWFATQDGLNKYDGIDFKVYQKLFEDITRDSFSKLGKVYTAPTGAIYISTIEGKLEVFDNETQSFRALPTPHPPSSIYQDEQQNFWLGTFENGLYTVKANSKDTIQVLRGVDARRDIYGIAKHKDSIVLAASGRVFMVDPVSLAYSSFSSEADIVTNFSSIATNHRDTLWVGSFGQGLFFRSNNHKTLRKFTGFNAANKLGSQLNIEALYLDSSNRLWVGTYGDGAYLIDLDSQEIQHFTPQSYNPKSIHYNDVLCIFEDNTGVIWLGTDGGGLSFYDENLSKFNELTRLQTPDFASVDVPRAITVDDEGAVWIGTSGKGLTRYNPNTNKFNSFTTKSNPRQRIPSDRVMSLYGINDAVWVGLQDAGLAIVNRKGVTSFHPSSIPPLPALTVWCIFRDIKERTWLGTRENGLIEFDEALGVVRHFTSDTSNIVSNTIRVISQGDDDTMWLGTEDQGLMKFMPEVGEFVSFQQKEILKIKSLYYSAPYLWIGTNGNGLHRLHTKTEQLKSYSLDDGLPNNVIYGILPDEDGNLWLSSNRGITKFQPDSDSTQPIITNYDTHDGLQSMEFNTGASFRNDDGTLYFGGLNGINWFQPDQLSGNPVPPQTVINKMELFGEEIQMSPDQKFSARKNTITFSFAGLHFSQPRSNQYKYRLTNYETNWSKPSSTHFAHYPNLPSGNYTFEVLSSNYEGVWDSSAATYSFVIKPPWYLTHMAIILYFLLVGLILLTIYRYLKWRWKIQVRLQMEHEETERLRTLDELKSKLYTNISHEFRTPLTLISAPVQQLLNSSQLNETHKKSLQIIEGSSQRMLRLVNQLLDLSKLEKGAVQLQVNKHELGPQLIQLLEAFTLNANEKGVLINSHMDNFGDTWYDRDVVEKIVSNLLSNAVKYAPENSNVEFTATYVKGFLILKTVNVNTSLSEKQINKLFNRFYQVDKNATGVGVGLSLIKELTLLSNGAASAWKESEESISFEVKIPVDKEYYNANSIIPQTQHSAVYESDVESIFEDNTNESAQILVVEDNDEIRAYIASLFNDNYSVSQASDGLEGIKKAINDIPDLIISDIMMPKKDGIEVCNTLKNDTRTSHIPIILLTAKSGDSNELKGLQSKADDYITKPFNAEVVKQKALNIIASRRALRNRYSQNVFLKPKDIAFTPVDELFLEEVQNLIDNEVANSTFNAQEFAEKLAMSRMQLHRKIKALTGLSTSEFIRSQRLKLSCGLLKDSGLTINEIAYSVGFNTPSYYIKCFKEAYGTTPSEYVTK